MRDAGRVRAALPWIASGRASCAAAGRELEPHHRAYVTTVSSPRMAISLELAAFLAHACTALAPGRVLDLGSGFSSFVLRRCAFGSSAPDGSGLAGGAGGAGGGASAPYVASVDHDAGWLDATRRYLEGKGVPTAGLATWEAFRARPHEPFDLVLHDLGGPGLDHIAHRLAVLPEVLRWTAPGGVLLLDDANLPALGPAARALLKREGWPSWSLRRFLRDGFGRWALLGVKPR